MIQQYACNNLTYIHVHVGLLQDTIQQLKAPEEDLWYIGRNVALILLYHVCIVSIS